MDLIMQQSIADALVFPAMLLDGNYQICAANKPAEALLEMPLRGVDFTRALRHPEALRCLNAAMSSRKGQSCDLTLTLNTNRTYEMSCAPLGSENVILLTLLDVSAEIDAEKSRSTFVANVSHELRSPLTALMGIVETLRGPARDDIGARDKFLGLMETETKRMSRLVGDLLSLAKLEAKEHLTPQGKVNVFDVLNGVVSSLSASQRDYEGRIMVAHKGEIPIVVGDQDELTEVFQNILENALKYSTPNTPVAVKLTSPPPRSPANSRRVIVTISDQGEGVAAKHIPRLTERFYRVDKGRSRLTGGTGLGLAITKHILNRHRARFHIRSEENIGTKVTISLRV